MVIQPTKDDFIAVGSSHLARTVVPMRSLGDNITCLASPTWRLTEENVATAAASLSEALKKNTTATIIYQLYDSSIYFASSAPGEQALPKRGDDGIYHVPGELVLADWAAFPKIFYVSVPLLRVGGSNKKVILSPLPRFSTAKCCNDTQHIINFGKKGYGTNMGLGLGEIHGWIEDFSGGKCIQNFTVVCPSTTLSEVDSETVSKKDLPVYWGSDPVHLTPLGYAKLGEQLSEMVASDNRKKRGREEGQAGLLQQHQKPRTDSSSRLAGLSRSDTFASRWEKNDGQGGRHKTQPPKRVKKDGQLGQKFCLKAKCPSSKNCKKFFICNIY